MDSLAFLEQGERNKPQPIYVLQGEEDFLKRQVVAVLKAMVLGEGDDAFGLSTYEGDTATFAQVHDDLDTLPFLSPRRLVIVERADPFVTLCRSSLEMYVAQPSATGVLVLDVKSWPGNTRLAKQVPEAATIVCKSLAVQQLPSWCVRWAAARHSKKLASPAAQLLVDLVGAEMGLLDQELTKLAIYVDKAPKIEAADVDRLVGRSRDADTFKIFEAIGNGRAGEALAILAQLFDQGGDPIVILGAFNWQLRRLAQAFRLNQQGMPLSAAFDQVGVISWGQKRAEQQLRHLGRRRANRLYDWLLEVDLGLKGSSQLPARTQLERLVVRLARPRDT